MPEQDGGLAAFQKHFAQALTAPELSARPWAGSGFDAALAVYRNTVGTGCIDALAATFPTVLQMVGEAWFVAAALAFQRAQPPLEPRMTEFGAGFPDWLATFPPAQTLPYLAACARLDAAWLQAHIAPGGSARRHLPDVATGRLIPQPSLRLFRFSTSVPSLWLAHRDPHGLPDELVFGPAEEGLAIWRPDLEVEARLLSLAEHAFLQACLDGGSVRTALSRALAASPPTDVAFALNLPTSLTTAGFFAGADPGVASA